MMERPLRDLTATEAEAFDRDGVVCVRQVIPQHWIDPLATAVERTKGRLTPIGAMQSKPEEGFINDLFMWINDEVFRAFVFESPAARLAHQAMGSRTVTFFYDQLFVKEPGTQIPTPWHHDLPFWPVEGSQICSIWMPLDPVTRESSGLEYVRGSHRWNKRFKAITPDYNAYMMASDLENPPDIDSHRDDYDLVNWAMEPGDVLMFHPLVLHGSSGNATTTRRRRALATRWLGDDVVYAPRRATMPIPLEPKLQPGERIHGRYFPVVIGNDPPSTSPRDDGGTTGGRE